MNHLKRILTIVFLDPGFHVIQKRIHNFENLGIAKADDQSFEDLYRECRQLYRKYAEKIVDANLREEDFLAEKIARMLNNETLVN